MIKKSTFKKLTSLFEQSSEVADCSSVFFINKKCLVFKVYLKQLKESIHEIV